MNASSARALKKLNLIRLLMSHPKGIGFEELKRLMGFSSSSDLKKELGQLYMIESYPYSPMDFVEVEFNGDLVKLRLPVPLEKSFPLTPLEWSTLRSIVLGAEESKTPAFSSILSKINSVIPTQTWNENPSLLPVLNEAIQKGARLNFSYWKRTAKDLENRSVQPLALLNQSESYLLGYDLDKLSFRAFRVDCISEPVIDSTFSQTVLPEGWESWKNQFLKQLNLEESSEGALATLWATDSAGYHLSRRLPLKKTGKSTLIQKTTYLEFQATIPEESWFVDTILGYGKSIFVTNPSDLKARIQSLLP